LPRRDRLDPDFPGPSPSGFPEQSVKETGFPLRKTPRAGSGQLDLGASCFQLALDLFGFVLVDAFLDLAAGFDQRPWLLSGQDR
jgi:hypothetical protein